MKKFTALVFTLTFLLGILVISAQQTRPRRVGDSPAPPPTSTTNSNRPPVLGRAPNSQSSTQQPNAPSNEPVEVDSNSTLR